MRNLLTPVIALCLAAGAATAQPAKPASAKPPVSKKTLAAKGVVHKSATAGAHNTAAVTRPKSSSTARTSTSRNAKKAPVAATRVASWRTRQLAPAPERYKEIQTALVEKGYLKPEDATGAWDQNSADALKKFQAEQSLDSSGKINSLSLIALGLGPHHDDAVTHPQQAQN